MALLSTAIWLVISALFGLYEELISHFFFCKFIDAKNASVIFSIAKSFDGISSLMYNKIAPPFLSRSRPKGLLKPFMKNYPIGKLSSSFVSIIIKVSILFLIW